MVDKFLRTIVISAILGFFLGFFAYQISTLFVTSSQTDLLLPPIEQPILLTKSQTQLDVQEPTMFDSISSESLPSPLEEPQITPEPAPTQTPLREPSQASSPTPATPVDVSSSPSPIPVDSATPQPGLNADMLFDLINQHRSKLGLASFEKDDKICTVAQSRAPELAGEFGRGNLHSGFYSRHLPFRASENVIQMKTEEQALSWWLHSAIHRSAIEGDYKYSCIACSSNNCSEVFTSFSPKADLKPIESTNKMQ